jgi:metal-responsive CopG/Arc/MetJ family transcriptional regulator
MESKTTQRITVDMPYTLFVAFGKTKFRQACATDTEAIRCLIRSVVEEEVSAVKDDKND